MKTRTLVSILISILFLILLINGCATTAGPTKPARTGGTAKPSRPTRMTEPANADSTLLIGRITLTCDNFPHDWHVGGVYKNRVAIKFKNRTTYETLTVRSKGSEGLFYLVDTPGPYEIIKLTYMMGGGRFKTTLQYNSSYLINIEKGAVNNLGDIHWTETFEMITSRSTHEEIGRTHADLHFKKNYSEVKKWFQMTFPNSNWNNRKWTDM